MAQIQAVSFVQDNRRGKPNEDFLQIGEDGRFAVVADGVTRMLEDGQYPSISARDASECVCHALCDGYRMGINDLRTLFIAANRGVAELNRIHGIREDSKLLGTVAVAGYFLPGYPSTFWYAFIGDCGMLVYNRDLFPICMTPNQVVALELFRDGWGLPEEARMQMWCSMLRNKSSERRMTYGGLTGEVVALDYLRADFIRDLMPGDTIVLYTDGILPFVYEAEFRAHVQVYARLGEGYLPQIHRYLKTATEKLAGNEVKNLDDDRAFVAFSYDE